MRKINKITKDQKLKKDFGTPQLMEKRLKDLTTEPLDICLKKDLIQKEEHMCGMHFRWLYILKFGTSAVNAADLSRTVGRPISRYSDEMYLRIHSKYNLWSSRLEKVGAYNIVRDVCVFNRMPLFLLKSGLESEIEFFRFYEGLATLKILQQRGKVLHKNVECKH